MNKISWLKITLICMTTLISPATAVAGEINTGPRDGELAIYGFDPVAYFTEQRAAEGDASINYRWLGAQWHFTSEKHRQMFSEDPVRYAPQYGGHCAHAVVYGFAEKIVDPEAWRIIDGKLYLFGSREAAIRFLEARGSLNKSRKKWPKIQARLVEESN